VEEKDGHIYQRTRTAAISSKKLDFQPQSDAKNEEDSFLLCTSLLLPASSNMKRKDQNLIRNCSKLYIFLSSLYIIHFAIIVHITWGVRPNHRSCTISHYFSPIAPITTRTSRILPDRDTIAFLGHCTMNKVVIQ
jgi:hypothetical protein